MTVTDLSQEDLKRYKAYIKEYGKYLSEAKSEEEKKEIQRKVQEICFAEFGVNDQSKIAFDLWCQAYNPYMIDDKAHILPYPNGNANTATSQKDIKSLKIVVIVLACAVIYLLAKRK